MAVPRATWRETALWDAIGHRGDISSRDVCAVLDRCMPMIEDVLASGGTSPKDFTLHDSGHSYRVARRMVELVPDDVIAKLSSYELGLLLLSAYLHDIGMTPEAGKIQLHYQFLLTGETKSPGATKQCLSEQQVAELQRWLDDDARGGINPIPPGPPNSESLQLASELTAYYCRHRHNDWGAEWTREHLREETLYAGWLDDLVMLCQSHHWGQRELLEKHFDPRLVGSPSQVVHLRYLACVLRISDILEFDPERTPEVILRHRGIAPGSLIYWYKDHEISLTKQHDRIIVCARPSNARVHRAVEVMLDEIDRELYLCRSLADHTHFEACPGLTEPLPHRWDLPSSLHRDLQPRSNTYEYIDGAFRPNTRKLLQLLSGIELYGSPIVAVRELLQNAFDAVREQIAYERLEHSSPASVETESVVRRLHRVELQLEQAEDDGWWLICVDSGVGMTKEIITDHLLVSGQSRRHDVLALERRCKRAGFELGRTGQFGIGVLSYFMIAERVRIRTRRSLGPRDGDATGWCFETEGVGSFGELRRDTSLARGTRVELRLRSEIADDSKEFFLQLRKYLQDIIAIAPCEVILRSSFPDAPALAVGAGWTLDRRRVVSQAMEEQLRDPVLGLGVIRTPTELTPKESQDRRESQQKEETQLVGDALRCLSWCERSGELPGRLGRFRLTLPYFVLPGGASLAFLRIQEAEKLLRVANVRLGHMIIPKVRSISSWKGIRVAAGGVSADPPCVLIEVDFEDNRAATVHVSRDVMTENASAVEAMEWLQQREVRELVRDFLKANAASEFAWLNHRIAGAECVEVPNPKWVAVGDRSGHGVWRAVSFPAVSTLPSWVFTRAPTRGVTWKGRPVDIVQCLRGAGEKEHYDGLSWAGAFEAPDRIVAYEYYRPMVVPLWTLKVSKGRRASAGVVRTSRLPPSWKSLCGVQFAHFAKMFEGATVWNREHPLVRALTPEAWGWASGLRVEFVDPLAISAEILSDRGRAAAWMLRILGSGLRELWLGCGERSPSFVEGLWQLLFAKGARSALCLWLEAASDSRLRIVGPDRWETCKERSDVERWMPDPGDEWRLEGGVDEAAEGMRAVRRARLRGRASRGPAGRKSGPTGAGR